jgi:hypothetical protein
MGRTDRLSQSVMLFSLDVERKEKITRPDMAPQNVNLLPLLSYCHFLDVRE